jgi:hypothetical protein
VSARTLPPPGLPAAGAALPAKPAAPLVQAFVAFLLLCQVTLLVPEIGSARLFVRVAAFGASLAMLVMVRGRRERHPAATAGVLTLLVVALAIANPGTTSLVAGTAQAALYVSVMAPLFWVPRMSLDTKVLRQAVLILWVFHTVSAAVGVLQVYFPGSFQPPLSAIIVAKGKGYMDSLKIVTSTGQRVFRPMGLSDVPGGAAVSGLYAVLFGTGFFLTARSWGMRSAAALSMVTGMTALYLSQVRAVLVMTGIAVSAVVLILAWRRDLARLGTLAVAAAVVAVTAYGAAMSLAGPSVARRVATLTAERPGAVYYRERGHFLADAFEKTLPQAPLGSGLGRWGMVASYFGRDTGPGGGDNGVWVEIQWAGWIVDGGAPLMVLYCLTVAIALWTAWTVARGRAPAGAPELPFWGAVVLAQGVGAFSLTFSYPIFLSQPGMEFWLLNAALFAVTREATRQARLRAAAPAPAAPRAAA